MQYSMYETIINNSQFPMNALIISLDSVTWHWHNEYELIGILSGSMTAKVLSNEYVLKEGDMLLVNPREVHSLQNNGGECLCMILQLSEELFRFADTAEDEKEIHFYFDTTQEEEPDCGFALFYYRMARILYETLRADKVSVFRVRAQVCSLIADLLEFSVYDKRLKNRGDRDQQDMLIRLIGYLENHLMNEDILSDACLKFGISRKTFDRIVDGILGISAKDLLDNLRVEKAKGLLKYTTKSTGYIMDVCGYFSENTFYRSFKKSTGLTPKEYREQIQMNNERDELKGYLDYETPKVVSLLKDRIEEWENQTCR